MYTEFRNKIASLVSDYENNLSSADTANSHEYGELVNKEQHILLENIEEETTKALTPTNKSELDGITKTAIAHIPFSIAVK